MAHKIQTLFIDDLDGSPAEGTVRFSLDDQGIAVKDRGRIPAELVVDYKAATEQ